MLDHLRNLIHQGDVLFGAADTASATQLAQQKQQLDALTAQFKQNAAAMLPLSKIGILLDTYQRTLTNWREDVKDDIRGDLRELLFRVGVLAILIAIVVGFGEIWRRTTFRYVHETRRRYQFLLLRRITMWTAIGLIIIVTFASQLGSAVTFAGLLTAGIAVALQNVIVSIVAYFFLIGKYGIRVGDRVQIAGVTGEVVDLGLVRIHLMELAGPGGSQPTGRVVAFSNSIVFQPGPGVFKQIPGTSFVWHEMKLTLAGDADFHTARERITKAVETALADYRPSIEAQREVMARNLTSVSPGELKPRVHLQHTAAGIEATVTFPVEFQNASEMDDHLMKEAMAALEQEPRIKLVGAEMQPAK
jgi:small-conductance mechanosensitive channel